MKNLTQWLKIFQILDENKKRWLAAEKSQDLGRGGLKLISELTGMSRTTIIKGLKELQEKKDFTSNRIRISGGGRKNIKDSNTALIKQIKKILDETTLGDPMSALKWTCKSTRKIAEELEKQGFSISQKTVCNLLNELEYSLQANKKVLSGAENPNRDEQFQYINSVVKKCIDRSVPVISVDTKKKELVGQFKNNGKTWSKKGNGKKVLDHDFKSYAEGVAIPYGAYDIQGNEGFVNVGVSSDTAEFAVNTIAQWWRIFGKKRYPKTSKLLVCADGGGSNGSRNRLWKLSLQKLANETGIDITVCHYPPGTSKWNKIEHRMFSFISLNWQGVPLENYETIIKLIGGTTTKTGLKIKAKLDNRVYRKGIKVSDDAFEEINVKHHKKFPNWNYTIQACA